MDILRTVKHILAGLTILVVTSSVCAQKIYSSEERSKEEAHIRQDIEEKLDWKNRTKETLDEFKDQDRMLFGTLNESVLLSQQSGERFGVFESFRDNGRKAIEVRLHREDKLTDRFFLYGDACKGASISASRITKDFSLFEMGCYTTGKTGEIEGRFEPYLFDQTSRNFYLLAVLDYDPKANKAPTVKYENGIYKVYWRVLLRGASKATTISRSFKIRNENGRWSVKELPPIDDEAASISPLQRLPIKSDFDLPSFVAERRTRK